MATYEVIGSATGLDIGQRVTDEQLKNDYAHLGGADRLIANKVLKPASGDAKKADETDPKDPKLNTGAPPPLKDQAEAVPAQPTADAAPAPKTRPGSVQRKTEKDDDAR